MVYTDPPSSTHRSDPTTVQPPGKDSSIQYEPVSESESHSGERQSVESSQVEEELSHEAKASNGRPPGGVGEGEESDDGGVGESEDSTEQSSGSDAEEDIRVQQVNDRAIPVHASLMLHPSLPLHVPLM